MNDCKETFGQAPIPATVGGDAANYDFTYAGGNLLIRAADMSSVVTACGKARPTPSGAAAVCLAAYITMEDVLSALLLK